MSETRIRVGHENFSVGDEYQWLAQCDEDGAVVTSTAWASCGRAMKSFLSA